MLAVVAFGRRLGLGAASVLAWTAVAVRRRAGPDPEMGSLAALDFDPDLSDLPPELLSRFARMRTRE
jgi:hypothetical protein